MVGDLSMAARDELVSVAVEVAVDRDRWRALAIDLQARLDGGGDDHDPWLWRIWQARAIEAEARADELGTRAATAERDLHRLLNRRKAK